MCGIVGAIAQRDVAAILLEGLRRLEYRGYDSAGIALLDAQHQLNRRRTQGKVAELAASLAASPLTGTVGIAHTRWATHGVPSEANAHPHISGNSIALVHNGIIENYETLRRELEAKGYVFDSKTDTETIVHNIHSQIKTGQEFLEAVQRCTSELEGAYSLAIINSADPDRLIAVRSGCPLVIGLGIGENFLASDYLALLPVTQRFIYLEEGDIADIRRESVRIYNQGQHVERVVREFDANYDAANKAGYRHYMKKEIFEQADAVAKTLEGRLGKNHVLDAIFGTGSRERFEKVKRIHITACGTSYHAALLAQYWLESFAKLPTHVEIASEFRYRENVVEPDTLFISISQSGETADTLAALRKARENKNYLTTLAICNVPESSLVRESELSLMTRAGPEIGVASTKAFTTQLVVLLMLTAVLSRFNGVPEHENYIVEQLLQIPKAMNHILTLDSEIKNWVYDLIDKEHMLYLGRGTQYPIAKEGALKMKELSYIQAEAYPAGELKHGPLALVDATMPVIAVVPNNELLEKLKSNLQEVRTRGGKLYLFADKEASLEVESDIRVIKMAHVDDLIAPIIYVIPLQLLAYYVAVGRGTDVDQPRNLAKSVTVE